MITRLYLREKAFVYTRANPKSDCVDQSDIIFRINESHKVKQQISATDSENPTKGPVDLILGSSMDLLPAE